MGTECGGKMDVAEVRGLNWCESRSEPCNWAVGRCCRVVRRREKPCVAWGQDRDRRSAAKHLDFSKWDLELMLGP
jgi:hypothetical protein